MSDFTTALTGAGTVTAVALTFFARALPPLPVRTTVRPVAVEVSLQELLDGPEVEAHDFEYCPAEQRTRFHALRTDGSRRCWTCACESPAGAR